MWVFAERDGAWGEIASGRPNHALYRRPDGHSGLPFEVEFRPHHAGAGVEGLEEAREQGRTVVLCGRLAYYQQQSLAGTIKQIDHVFGTGLVLLVIECVDGPPASWTPYHVALLHPDPEARSFAGGDPLIFADWLEERGELDAAERIRVIC